jgi:uncharacterized protein
MLIEFSVRNYRSIAERQKLSMVAGASAARRHQNSMATGNAFAPHALRSACLFGPNGAGKTSIVRAMAFFQRFVVTSAKDATAGDLINVTPFKFDPGLREQPSEFEIVFVAEGSLYQYGFSADENRVWSEWLFMRPNSSGSRIRTVFQREYEEESEEYQWYINDAHVKGEKETWKSATRDNALFVSTTIQLNSDVFRTPHLWIDSYFRVLASPERLSSETTAERSVQESHKAKVLEFLRSVDLEIDDFAIDEKQLEVPKEFEEMLKEQVLEAFRKRTSQAKEYKVRTLRTTDGSSIELDLDQESDGTQVLFSLAGPLIETLEEGYTMIVDELHNSLHPLALRHLVELFHNPSVNTKGAQLIFTSHDTSIISKGFMHRDQVWLVERQGKQGSHLYPLSDFNVRELDSFQKAYLSGRYGALPRIRETLNGE